MKNIKSSKKTKKTRPWHEQNRFWTSVFPVLFHKRRLENTPDEVERIMSLLKIGQGAQILDLCCGVGRHSIEFARHGMQVTGVDITTKYLKEARKRALKAGVSIKFIRADMRKFCRPKSFDVVVNLFTSFGYFQNQRDDYVVAKHAFDSLKKNGVLLMGLMGKEVLARIFRKRDWYEIDGLIVLEERETDQCWGYVKARWILIKGTTKKEFRIKIRLYSAVELTALLKDVGFRKVDIYGDLAGSPYDNTANRLVIVAQK